MEVRVEPNYKMIIDAEDYNKVIRYRWRYNKGYAETKVEGKTTGAHRLIMNIPIKDKVVDHINGNKLDNRKNNLRVVDVQGNALNRKLNKNNKVGRRGVSITNDGRVFAQMKIDGKMYNMGSYDNLEQASQVYDHIHRLRKYLHGLQPDLYS